VGLDLRVKEMKINADPENRRMVCHQSEGVKISINVAIKNAYKAAIKITKWFFLP